MHCMLSQPLSLLARMPAFAHWDVVVVLLHDMYVPNVGINFMHHDSLILCKPQI